MRSIADPKARLRTLVFLVVAGSVLAGIGVAVAVAPDPRHTDASVEPSTGPSRVLAALGSDRVTSLSSDGRRSRAVGSASVVPGDAARSLWYEAMAAVALAQSSGLRSAEMTTLDPQGKTLETEPGVVGVGPIDPFAPIVLDERAVSDMVETQATALGVGDQVSMHYVGLYGGTAEVVVAPDDLKAFLASAREASARLLGPLMDRGHAYLFTVTDDAGDPQLVMGFVPGLNDGAGIGIAWSAPGVDAGSVMVGGAP